jgi:hypothetical protein
MPEITSAPDLTVLHLMNCIRTSQITITSAISDSLLAGGKRGKSWRIPGQKLHHESLNAFLRPK